MGTFDTQTKRHESLIKRFCAETKTSRQAARSVFRELQKFLDLCWRSEEPCAPSMLVDQMWHAFLLDTQAYVGYCLARYGRFIHHTPSDETSDKRRVYAATRRRLARSFGALDPSIWPVSTKHSTPCSNCQHAPCSGK